MPEATLPEATMPEALEGHPRPTRRRFGLMVAAVATVAAAMPPVAAQGARPAPANPQIDAAGFVRDVLEVQSLRAARRVSEADFVRMAAQPDTVVLDARSARLFALRHVTGAVNLPFTEFTAQSLAAVIPSRDTRVLIYCNNNFVGAPESMAMKAPAAALNLSTFVALHSYGYRNVYELAPALDVARSKLRYEGSEVRRGG